MQMEMLKEVWSLSPGEFVSLPHFDGRTWNNGKLWHKKTAANAHLSGVWAWDWYFSPLTYDTQAGGRRRNNITSAGVIYADIDGRPKVTTLPRPSLVVASGSPGHEHWYWFLDEPVPIGQWELHARGTTEILGADPGGWDSTQVLRIPGSQNFKHRPPSQVEVVSYTGTRYSIERFPQTSAPVVVVGDDELPPLPKVTKEAYDLALGWAWPLLSIEDKLLLTGAERARDRSKVIWRMIREWRDQLGFSEATIFLLIQPAPFNKWKTQPEKLWAQIHK